MTQEIRGFRGEYYFLSNFFDSPIVIAYRGRTFTMKTGEHAFHAMKVAAMIDASDQATLDYLERMQQAPTPGKSKYLGRSVAIDSARWDAMSYACMERVTELKYEQNSSLAHLLVSTAPAVLVEENDWNDRLWGTVNGVGKNQLGQILMDRRATLINKEK